MHVRVSLMLNMYDVHINSIYSERTQFLCLTSRKIYQWTAVGAPPDLPRYSNQFVVTFQNL